MKAIILAGGMGTRLGKYTKDLPKCMLEFLGKTLIQRQVETLKSCGVNDIIITRKHLKEKISIENVHYDDKEPDDTNMLDDFIHAIKNLDEDILLCYGDILFEEKLINEVKKFPGEVGVAADRDWKEYWIEKNGSFMEDSESFVVGEDNKLISLGAPDPKEEEMDARYIGIIKFSKKIVKEIIQLYDELKENYWDVPWNFSPSFKKAYMTDFLQELINRKFDVQAILFKRGWIEFDTVKDYEQANSWAKEKTLDRFIHLS